MEDGRNGRGQPKPAGGVRFFICTRDRPQTLSLAVHSLSRAFRQTFPGARARCYIVDDSTRPAFSAQVRRIAGSASCGELGISVIGRAGQDAVFEHLAGRARGLEILRTACRPLGEGPWDLAGVRNFASLLGYCYSSEDDIVVFLDDDILLASAVYCGRRLTIDGESLMRELVRSTPARQAVASGAAYLGRLDGSVVDHLRFFLEDAEGADTGEKASGWLEQLALFPTALPVKLVLPGTGAGNDGPGISGALLATTPLALQSHFLPSCYNEDWIWLGLLGRVGAAVRVADGRALHAGPPQSAAEGDLLGYQNTGEAVYRAVREVMKGAPPGSDALAWCVDGITTDHFRSGQTSVIEDIRELLENGGRIEKLIGRCQGRLRGAVRRGASEMRRCMEDALGQAEAMDPAALYGWFRQYLSGAPAWRSLLQQAREVLKGEEEWRAGRAIGNPR